MLFGRTEVSVVSGALPPLAFSVFCSFSSRVILPTTVFWYSGSAVAVVFWYWGWSCSSAWRLSILPADGRPAAAAMGSAIGFDVGVVVFVVLVGVGVDVVD